MSENVSCTTDVDDDPVRVERSALELDVDHICGAMQSLCGPKDFTPEAVCDHHMIAHRHTEHRYSLTRT
jgi:hypothetical protein